MSENPLAYLFIVVLLLAFGIGYDRFIGLLERRGYDRGYTALFVVVGDGVVLLALGILVGWVVALMAFGLFAAAGLPMAVGSWLRHVKAREHDEEQADEVLLEKLS